jgi:hypothetical protein
MHNSENEDRTGNSLPPPPTILSPITTRLSNTTTNSVEEKKPLTPQQRAKDMKKKKRAGRGADVESDWSSDAVSAVSSSVNLAIDKLKSLAQPYYYQHQHQGRTLTAANANSTGEEAPDVINTSTEVSADERAPSSANNSSTGQSVDGHSSSSELEANGLDMKALEMELRANEESTKITLADEIAKENATDPKIISAEANSYLTPQASVEAKIRQPQAKSKEAKKSSPTEVRDPKKTLSLSTIGAPMMKQLEAASRKGIYALHGIAVRDGANPSKPSRAITPIMRMRSKASEQLATDLDESASPARRSHASSNLDEEDYFALKQKRWKEKMKLVEEEREKERNILNGESEARNRRRRKKRGKRSKHSRRRATDDERSYFSNKSANTYSGFGECKNEISVLIGKLLRTQCGSLDDAFVDDDESTDDSDSESGDDETATEDLLSADVDFASASSTAKQIITKDSAKHEKKPDVQVAAAALADPEKNVGEETLDSTVSNRKSKAKNSYDTKRTSKEKNDLDMKDKNFIRQFIAGVTRTGTVLMMHEKDVGKSSLKRPTKHIFFIQPGTLAKCGRYVGPSLVWKAMDSNLIGEVDLFDVSSLDKASARQLADYPLAMPGRSLFIRTIQGAEYVFEAKTEDQAVRFVHGMRWVIARLTFNLIIGNVNVSCELLDVERGNEEDHNAAEKIPQTPGGEVQWTIAMNEVASHLVDKASTT